MLTFLRSLFVTHDWIREPGSNVRRCSICGLREELDVDDGASLNAWYVIWKGYPEAHFGKKGARPAAAQPRPIGQGTPAGADDVIATHGSVARIQDPGDFL